MCGKRLFEPSDPLRDRILSPAHLVGNQVYANLGLHLTRLCHPRITEQMASFFINLALASTLHELKHIFIRKKVFLEMMKTAKTEKPKASEKAQFKRYRCEICDFTSEKPGEHCGNQMVDLQSNTCMGCRGCGHHF